MVVRSGPVDGYLRPDQFLDHVTVIINLWIKAFFCRFQLWFHFFARFVTRWPRKEQPSVESGPISNLLFRNGQLQPSWRFQYQGGKKNYYRFCLWNGCPALLKWTFDWSENLIVARICKQILKIGICSPSRKIPFTSKDYPMQWWWWNQVL